MDSLRDYLFGGGEEILTANNKIIHCDTKAHFWSVGLTVSASEGSHAKIQTIYLSARDLFSAARSLLSALKLFFSRNTSIRELEEANIKISLEQLKNIMRGGNTTSENTLPARKIVEEEAKEIHTNSNSQEEESPSSPVVTAAAFSPPHRALVEQEQSSDEFEQAGNLLSQELQEQGLEVEDWGDQISEEALEIHTNSNSQEEERPPPTVTVAAFSPPHRAPGEQEQPSDEFEQAGNPFSQELTEQSLEVENWGDQVSEEALQNINFGVGVGLGLQDEADMKALLATSIRPAVQQQQEESRSYLGSLLKDVKDLTGFSSLEQGVASLREGKMSAAVGQFAIGLLKITAVALVARYLLAPRDSSPYEYKPYKYDYDEYNYNRYGNRYGYNISEYKYEQKPLIAAPIPSVNASLITTTALGALAATGQGFLQPTLITAFDKNVKEYADYVIPNQVAYAQKKGLKHVSYEGNLAHDYGVFRAPYWSKVVALNDQLQKGTEGEWLVWLDASAIFTNTEKTFTDIIHRYGDKDIIMTTDPDVPINNAVFLVRNTPWTREWIKKVWERIDLARGGEGNCWSSGQPICHYEQQAMTELFQNDPDVESHGGDP